jgi:type I restriction enzyme, R subunit
MGTPANNVYHVTDEFEIERLNSTQTRRPDIVVFVNGILLVAIECKRIEEKMFGNIIICVSKAK